MSIRQPTRRYVFMLGLRDVRLRRYRLITIRQWRKPRPAYLNTWYARGVALGYRIYGGPS